MKRLWAFLATAAVLAGCRTSQPATNPFLRTTVPPPGTGAVAVTPGEPYSLGAPAAAPLSAPGTFSPTAPGVAPGMPATPPPGPVVAPPPLGAPPSNNRYAPPGGSFQYNQSSKDQGKPAGSVALATDNKIIVAGDGESGEQASVVVTKSSSGGVVRASYQEAADGLASAEGDEAFGADASRAAVAVDKQVANAVRIVGTSADPSPRIADPGEPSPNPVIRVTAGQPAGAEQEAADSTIREVRRFPLQEPTLARTGRGGYSIGRHDLQ